jgi:RND family efflux transporter MFP subunit
MKKALIFVAIALILICGIGSYLMKSMAGMQAAASQIKPGYTVSKGNIVVSVVDSGTIDAVNSVEVKSRVSGRLKKLFVDEGYFVTQGQVIGVIDPQETEFTVAQNEAQLRGAQSGAAKTSIEIAQRRVSAKADYDQAVSRLHRLDMELGVQPTLTSTAILEAQAEYNRNLRDRENLIRNVQPNAKSQAITTQRDADVSFANAKREYDRQQSLLAQGFVAGREMESAKLQMDLAKLKLDQANAELGRIENGQSLELAKTNEAVRSSEAAFQRAKVNSIQNGVKREEYRQAVGDVTKARAALQDVASLQRSREQNLATVSQLASVLRDSQRQLRETQIRAPITGVVTKKLLKEGELATGLSGFSAGTPIIRVEDRTGLRVKLNVNEIDVAKLREGMPADITVDALPDEKFTGVVRRISPTSNEIAAGTSSAEAVVKYEVEIRLNSTDKRLRSGMSAKCSLDVVRRNDVVTVAKDYVAKDEKGYYVVLASNAKPGAPGSPPAAESKTYIKIGAESGAQYEVVSGINVGDKLVAPKYVGPPRKGMMQMGGD